MKMTVKEAINKIEDIVTAIGRVSDYEYNAAKDEHECDVCKDIIYLLGEYRSIVLSGKVDI